MLKRHEIEILLKTGHPKTEVARLAGVSARSVHRIAEENPIVDVNDSAERALRHIGRPSIVEDFRKFILDILNEKADLPSREILRRVRLAGYHGGKTALYDLIASLRPKPVKPVVRFEGLPGEFSQHDFGQFNVKFVDGTVRRVHFFASRLKYSRYIRVSLVQDEAVESLVRTLAQHLYGWGGRPLLCVFDRPRTIALKWNRNGEVTEWNPVFAYATLEMGIGVELCWPYQANQKGSVENLVKFVKSSFFKVRSFHDEEDLKEQLLEWHREVNQELPCRATGRGGLLLAPARVIFRAPIGVAPVLLLAGVLDGAASRLHLALRQAARIAGRRRRRRRLALRPGLRLHLEGRTRLLGRGGGNALAPALGLDDHGLGPAVAEALAHSAGLDRARRTGLQGQRRPTALRRLLAVVVVVVRVAHSLALL